MVTLYRRTSQPINSPTRHHGATGLVLSVGCQSVQPMGGRVEAQGRPGQGSVFSAGVVCGLPVAAVLPASEAAGPTRGTDRCLYILAAEDNSVNQVLIQAMLENLGHRVEIVANGVLALQRAQDAVHDLILMDMQMPEMNGIEAARAIRRLRSPVAQIPIVAMTANARAEDRQACLDAGMDDYVSKPIHLPTLQAALLRATRQ